MAGFEVIVRPVVFPSIRPQKQRVLPTESDPEQGVCTIEGNSGGIIDLTHTWSVSKSKSMNWKEIARVSDKVRIKQKEKDGTINHDNFVDVMAVKSILTARDDGRIHEQRFRPAKAEDNIEIIQANIIDQGN